MFIAVLAPVLSGAVFGVAHYLPSRKITVERPIEAFVSKALDDFMEQAANFVDELAVSAKSRFVQIYQLKDFADLRDEFIKERASFLEIHLEQMKVRLYKKGSLEKEADILLKGDPQHWGGTAAGVYKIESGSPTGFSVVSDVYMPYSLKFYGKYFIHGEPYYRWGDKMISEASGGCLRLDNEDAKEIYEQTEINMPVLVIDRENDDYQYDSFAQEPFPEITAKTYLVGDLGSNFVIASKKPREKKQIASITKLMTAIVTAEQLDLRETIEIKKKMLDDGYGETEVLEQGKTFRLVELFYPLLRESSNDAAEAISYFLGRLGTVEKMNQKAKAILMPDTQFTCVSGYDEGNISTAQDLFYLARYVFYNRPPLLEISRGGKAPSFGELSFDIEKLWDKNIFSQDPTFLGGKTGFTESALYTGIFIFRFRDENNQERNIVIILLGSEHLFSLKSDTQKIYLWLMRNYFPKTLIE